MLLLCSNVVKFFFSSRRRHTSCSRDWSSDVCSSDLEPVAALGYQAYVCLFRPEEPTVENVAALHERRNRLMLELEEAGIATRQIGRASCRERIHTQNPAEAVEA